MIVSDIHIQLALWLTQSLRDSPAAPLCVCVCVCCVYVCVCVCVCEELPNPSIKKPFSDDHLLTSHAYQNQAKQAGQYENLRTFVNIPLTFIYNVIYKYLYSTWLLYPLTLEWVSTMTVIRGSQGSGSVLIHAGLRH